MDVVRSSIRGPAFPAIPAIRSLRPYVLFALMFAGSAEAVEAQSVRVVGVVREQGGRPLGGVIVEITSGSSGSATSDTTGVDGSYMIVAPAATTLLLSARSLGFEVVTLKISPLTGGERRAVAFTMSSLAQLDLVSVVAERERPLLDTRGATTGGRLERRELERLPTDARDPVTLAYTIPGVAQATGFFGDAPKLTINGANALYTQYSLDGLENNEGFLGGPRVEVPLSAISNLAVLANTYSAEFGRSSNGVVNMATRSGGDAWSGELFLYSRPGLPIDARAATIPRGTQPDDFRRAQEGFRRVQAGFAGGGPLAANTRGFGAVELTRETEDRIASTASTVFTGREQRDTWKLFGRVDQGWSPTQTTTLRTAASIVDRAGEGSGIVAPEADITTQRIGTATALIHRSSLRGGTASNEASVQLSTFMWNFPPTVASSEGRPQVTIFQAAGNDTVAAGVVGSSNFIFDEAERQLQLRNVFEGSISSAHRIRIGADVARSQFKLRASQTNPAGSYAVLDEGNIPSQANRYTFGDIPSTVRVLSYTVDAAQKQVDLSQTLYGVFVEDQWRTTPQLTVTAGLRWDYDDITSRGASSADLNNFQPRVAVNWLVSSNIVLRGGAGLYAGKFPYAVYSDAIQFGPDGNQTVTFDGAAVPRYLEGPRTATLDRTTLPPGEIRELFSLGLEQPMSTQFTLGWQAQIASFAAFFIDGVRTTTRNLPRSRDLNASTRGIGPGDTTSLPVSQGDQFRPVLPVTGEYRRLSTTESAGRGEYVGLYSALRLNVARDLTLDANYVLSRSRNDTEDINFNATQGNRFDLEWADAVNDRRHKVSTRATWTGAKHLTLAGLADYQSGTPINRVAGAIDPVTGLPGFRDLDGSGDTFGNGFLGNQDRFAGVPRNGERLPGAFLIHGSAQVALPTGGSVIALRADVFNLLNSTNPGGYANGIPGGGARTQVGRPGDPFVFANSGPPRQLQFSARIAF